MMFAHAGWCEACVADDLLYAKPPARGSALNHHVHLRALSDRRCLRAGCWRSRLRRPAGVPASSPDHSSPSGRAHRAGATPRDPLVQAHSAA